MRHPVRIRVRTKIKRGVKSRAQYPGLTRPSALVSGCVPQMTPRTGEIELPAEAFTNTRLWSRARQEVAANLPAWFYFFYGCLLLNTALTNFSPPLTQTAWTAIFPLSVFAVFTI